MTNECSLSTVTQCRSPIHEALGPRSASAPRREQERDREDNLITATIAPTQSSAAGPRPKPRPSLSEDVVNLSVNESVSSWNANEVTSVQLVQEYLRRIDVPDDVAVVGNGNTHAGGLTHPSLSTIEVFRAELRRLGARLLLERLAGSRVNQRILVGPSLWYGRRRRRWVTASRRVARLLRPATAASCCRKASHRNQTVPDVLKGHSMARNLTRRTLLASTGIAGAAAATTLAGAPAAAAKSPRKLAGPAARRLELYGLLGNLPSRRRPISGKKRSETERDGYILETWDLDLNGIENVPAYLARPKVSHGRAPGILFNHSHGGGYKIGKEEFVNGRSYLQPVPYAKELTDLGYVALCIDTWVFGERSHTSENDMFKAMLWEGQVLWGMMVYDSIRALDFLAARRDVDPDRLGTLGISMGSTAAWYLAALDERVKVTVDICCLTDAHTLLAQKNLSLHGLYYYVPDLLNHFTTAQINSLIAPRAHLGLAGRLDPLTPAEGLDKIERELDEVYARLGHPERWKLLRYDVAHQETAEGRQEIIKWLKRFL